MKCSQGVAAEHERMWHSSAGGGRRWGRGVPGSQLSVQKFRELLGWKVLLTRSGCCLFVDPGKTLSPPASSLMPPENGCGVVGSRRIIPTQSCCFSFWSHCDRNEHCQDLSCSVEGGEVHYKEPFSPFACKNSAVSLRRQPVHMNPSHGQFPLLTTPICI